MCAKGTLRLFHDLPRLRARSPKLRLPDILASVYNSSVLQYIETKQNPTQQNDKRIPKAGSLKMGQLFN